MTVAAIAVAPPRPALGTPAQLRVAWAIVLLLTVPEIVLRAFLALDTGWMLPARVALLALAVGIAQVWPALR